MNPFESARLAVGRRGASTWDEDMRLMWNAALEEAAKACAESPYTGEGEDFAAIIRAMIERTP